MVRRYIKPAVLRCACCLRTCGARRVRGRRLDLGTNPVETFRTRSANGACVSSLITLAITPLRDWLGALADALRRMLGLFAFFYVLVHFLTWLVLDQGLYWQGILDGHRETTVHHDRLPGVAAADSARHHVDERDDAPTRASAGKRSTGSST